MATECTQESVLDFLLENGGRVKNKDLVAHFKVFLSSENTKRAILKERFKRYVDNIAYVKQENGEKVVCLKKKYRYPEMRSGRAQDEKPFNDAADEDINRGIKALHFEENASVHEGIDDLKAVRDDEEELCVSDIALIEKDEIVHGNDVKPNAPELSNARSTGEAGVGRASVTPQVIVNRRRTSRGSQRSLLGSSEDGANDALPEDSSTPKCSRKNFIELMMSSSPQVRRSLVHRNSQGQMSARNSDFRMSSVDEDCASVTLDPLEHEWMMCTADGEWDSLQRLLECDPTLISKKDFITGFTCLHWAAKQGRHELFAMLVDFAKRHGVTVNVNTRSSAGYTPLHLAAMHNHKEVMKLLVGAYDADVDVRDYSGKKAAQYLRASVTGDIRDIVGACPNSDTENASGAGRWKLPKVLQSNLNPLRLLNHPEEMTADAQPRPKSLYRKSSIGRIRLQRNRFKTQIVHSTSFRENQEGEETLKSPVKSRPISNLFG
ncbi:ankyrin repeat domain-containing protein SOWAHC [Carassius carassius]|uniref:ankyrin repeat domain-containing protein SOWAHC n=1 Tax=Carassius carassius TaxID=217509 RepID=UPI0028693A58|nr:ankyrin repeat domain-containing protein SOWAHC [Carassius carassius]